MSTFTYLGNDRAGRRVKGLVAAESIRAARDRLRLDGIAIRSIQPRADKRSRNYFSTLRRKRLSAGLTEFLVELATLLQAGVPLLEAMDCSLPQTHPSLQEPLSAIRDSVAGGESLAEAMQREDWLFDDMTIGMIRVGEHAGNLEEILDQIAGFREQSAQLQDRVLSAVLYPAIVFCVSVGVTLFLMTVVVPMLLKNLAELGSQLPWPTRVLKLMSDSLLSHGWWLAALSGLLLAALAAWARTETGKLRLAKCTIRIPILGSLIRKQAIGRTALVVACLLRSGVELVQALRIAAQSCSNIIVRKSLLEATDDIERGLGLKEAIQKHSVFPASVAQIFSLGQQSGQLDSMLQRLGTDYDRQASVLGTRAASVAEPILILLLSVMVGFILFATVLPILEAGNVLAG